MTKRPVRTRCVNLNRHACVVRWAQWVKQMNLCSLHTSVYLPGCFCHTLSGLFETGQRFYFGSYEETYTREVPWDIIFWLLFAIVKCEGEWCSAEDKPYLIFLGLGFSIFGRTVPLTLSHNQGRCSNMRERWPCKVCYFCCSTSTRSPCGDLPRP